MDSQTTSPRAHTDADTLASGTPGNHVAPDLRRPYMTPTIESSAQSLPALLASSCGQPGTPTTPGCDLVSTPTGGG